MDPNPDRPFFRRELVAPVQHVWPSPTVNCWFWCAGVTTDHIWALGAAARRVGYIMYKVLKPCAYYSSIYVLQSVNGTVIHSLMNLNGVFLSRVLSKGLWGLTVWTVCFAVKMVCITGSLWLIASGMTHVWSVSGVFVAPLWLQRSWIIHRLMDFGVRAPENVC